MISVIDRFKVAAIGVYSSSFNFIYYKNGTLNNCGPQLPIDHAATAVGYIINQNKSEYAWIIKNSWGVKWGMNGHIQLGMCVPLSYVSFLSTQA
jgi:C1A family cysteine protease